MADMAQFFVVVACIGAVVYGFKKALDWFSGKGRK